MSFDVEKFRNNFGGHNEVSKSDKFDVYINIPPSVAVGSGYGMEQLALQCEVSELPGKDITMIEYRHYGFTKRIPHNNQYGHISFTFICAGDLIEKQIFDRWMDLLVPSDTGLVNYPLDVNNNPLYESQIMINQYDQLGNLVYVVNLIDAIPTSISSMSLDWNNDMVHRLTVTFAYFKWTTSQTTYGQAQSSSINDVQTNYSNQSPLTSTAGPSVQPIATPPDIESGGPNIDSIFNA
jgi:hypothetical protein